MIADFLKKADEVEKLSREFPGARIVINGLGLYAPVLDEAQWEHHFGAGSSSNAAADIIQERT